MFRAIHSGCVHGSLAPRSSLGALFIIVLASAIFSTAADAQEIPLQNCGGLLTIPVSTGDRTLTFLVDTAANSTFVNVKSFPYGISKPAAIANWHGTD